MDLGQTIADFIKTNDSVALASSLKQGFDESISENADFKELSQIIETYKLNEAEDLSFDSFKESIESAFKKHFPNGYVEVKQSKSFGSDADYINILMGMIGNPKDNTNGIIQNDKMRHTILLYPNKDGNSYSFKGDGRIYIKKLAGSSNSMDSIKTNIGNATSITLKKAQDKILKFIPKLADLMKENIENIAGVDQIDKKYLIVH